MGIYTRPPLGILYFLGESVEVPAEHLQAGLVAVPSGENGKPFDWSKLLGNLMRIHSQKEKPADANVAVHYRDYWYYIADNDLQSKATFSLVH